MNDHTAVSKITEEPRRLPGDYRATLEVRLVHPDGHVLEQHIQMTADMFAPISWRETERRQMAAQFHVGKESTKDDVTREFLDRRINSLQTATAMIAEALAKEMAKRERDPYGPWNW